LLDAAANDIGVVGGTFIEGATIDTPNVKEFDIMLAGAKRFYGL
jgi:D-amino-acid oxidase